MPSVSNFDINLFNLYSFFNVNYTEIKMVIEKLHYYINCTLLGIIIISIILKLVGLQIISQIQIPDSLIKKWNCKVFKNSLKSTPVLI